MAFTIRRVEYSYATVRDEPGAAYRILSQLAELGVNLLAFTAVPIGPSRAQLALFPEDPGKLAAAARAANLALDGPHHALLVQGDDELGALAGVHQRLFEAGHVLLRTLAQAGERRRRALLQGHEARGLRQDVAEAVVIDAADLRAVSEAGPFHRKGVHCFDLVLRRVAAPQAAGAEAEAKEKQCPNAPGHVRLRTTGLRSSSPQPPPAPQRSPS